MAEAIDELFVRLGLETDQEQFQQAESNFSSLQSTVLQVGAAIGTGLGINELTAEWARGIDEMAKKAEVLEGSGVTPQFISQMQGAFALIRGDAEEAIPFIEQMVRLLEDVDWGEINDSALARGLDLSGLQEAETAREAMEALQEQFQQIEDPQRQERLANAIGLSDDAFRLLKGGELGPIMDRAEELRPMTDEMVEAAKEFNEGWAELSRAMTSLTDRISESFVGELGEGMSEMADAIAENRKAIVSFWGEAKPILTGMAASLGAMATLRAAQSGLGFLKNIPGATLAAGAAGGAIWKRWQDAQSGEDITDQRDVNMHGPAENELGRILEDPLSREARAAIEGRSAAPALFDIPSLMEDMRTNRGTSEGGAQWGPSYEINIDARGANNPAEVEAAGERGARRALEEAADNTREDTRSEAQ